MSFVDVIAKKRDGFLPSREDLDANTGFARGELMIIDDHINLLGTHPLVGESDERF